jgi:glucose/arabinose dehydrogenase
MRTFALVALLFVPAGGAASFVYGEAASEWRGKQVANDLPKPFATPDVSKHPKVIDWPKGQTPRAPDGFKVSAFVRDLKSPRYLYVLPNGDLLVAQSSAVSEPKEESQKSKDDASSEQDSAFATGESPNQITLLRDEGGDGEPELQETFLKGLNQPYGVVLVDDTLFVANTDAVLSFPYRNGLTRIEDKGRLILALPGKGYHGHWTRNVVAHPFGSKLYIAVGSASNVAEDGMQAEILRACILECNLDGTGLREYATGLRNPVGMAWQPDTGALWTAVNERDGLGDDLVPDYLTSLEEGGFYGWPYAYFGDHPDPRREGERPDLVEKTLIPDVSLDSHTASLGLAFYDRDDAKRSFPEKYHYGAFVGQRGSWNRSKFAGYRVAFVPFKDGEPAGPPQDFLTGFIANEMEVFGRPVGVAIAADGSLLVADEPGNVVWRVSAK